MLRRDVRSIRNDLKPRLASCNQTYQYAYLWLQRDLIPLPGRRPVIQEAANATVPMLQVVNISQLRVLVFDGEEVVGGLQNRVVNTTC